MIEGRPRESLVLYDSPVEVRTNRHKPDGLSRPRLEFELFFVADYRRAGPP